MADIEVEFIEDYKTCHRKGSRFRAQAHFAKMLIECGYAKAIERPPVNKMVEGAERVKRAFYVE